MSTLRISDAPLLPDVDGTEKIPTGGRGDYAITVDQIKGHIFQDVGKELVGLGNVDNTSDLDKPISTAQQSALNLKADKTYVDANLDLKADKTSVYTRSETTLALSQKADLVNGTVPSNQLPSYVDDVVEYTTNTLPIIGESGKIYITTDTNRTWRWSGNQYVEISNGGVSDSTLKLQTPRKIANVDFDGTQDIIIPHNNLNNRDVSGSHPTGAILDESGASQQEINDFGGAKWYDKSGGYVLGATLKLENGDIVKSTVDGNTVDPNVDMTGWKFNDNTVESIDELLAIPSPKDNQRAYVKSYYAGLNSGGGEFVYTASTTSTQVNGFVMAAFGGVWRRVINPVHSIDDAGAHPTQTATVNTNAINDILKFVKCVNVPHADYNVLPDIIKLNNGNTLFGTGQLVGNAPNTLMIADGTGIYIHADDTDTAIIRGIKLKNGYKSNGIFLRRAKNIFIDDVTVDGMSYGIVVAEKDFNTANSGGSQNIIIQNPKILNTRYWGIYLRGANISTETLKSQNIKVINPYFYNCNMAGFVASEGNVKNFVLENPVFDRCNVSMHFEHASEFTVINPRDYDVGKKPDHVQANTEYPFVGWSMYYAFANDAQVIGGKMQSDCYHLAGVSAKSKNIRYANVQMRTNVFEGVGATQDADKNIFEDFSWSQCTTEREFIYHQALDEPRSWLRNFSITNSTCKLGINGNSGNGSYAAIASPRSKNMRINGNTIYNSTLRIACEDNLFVTANTWIGGTDNTEVVIEGLRGGLFGDFCEFTGNMFERAGGTVQGDAGVRMSNFTRIRADNVVRGMGVGYGYRFTNNYRIEIGGGMIYDFPLGQFVETGTTGGITYLYRA